jgi:chemotaxis protein CheX
MHLAETDIAQIVAGIWDSVLGMEIQPVSEGDSLPQSDPMLSACIQITGAWDGAVLLRCPTEVAQRVAAVMFDLEADSISLGDMQDSLGELVNMVSGGVKSLLPETCSLSLPAVTEGVEDTLSIRGASPVQKAAFTCHGQPVWVTLLERDAA